jgi:dipeptidyl aminopeptidase/acylaminoacyl peptidase
MAKWYAYIKDLPSDYYKKLAVELVGSMDGTPEQVPEAYRQISPIAHVANIQCPVLILHGTADEDVPVAHAHLLAQAIEKAGGEYDLKIFENAGHGLRSPEFRQSMDPLVLEFLNRYLQKPC